MESAELELWITDITNSTVFTSLKKALSGTDQPLGRFEQYIGYSRSQPVSRRGIAQDIVSVPWCF